MTEQICLLVTDDPDDHQAFSEALSEISADAIVLIILDSQKAIQLFKAYAHRFDYIFLDLSMNGIRINSFLKGIAGNPDLKSVRILVYGEEGSFARIDSNEKLVFFKKEYEYSELRDFLKMFLISPDAKQKE
jgi:CheY-like chemotaxis protein